MCFMVAGSLKPTFMCYSFLCKQFQRRETRFESGPTLNSMTMAYQSKPSIPCAFASRCYFTWLVCCDTRHPKTKRSKVSRAVPAWNS